LPFISSYSLFPFLPLLVVAQASRVWNPSSILNFHSSFRNNVHLSAAFNKTLVATAEDIAEHIGITF
jgi:hypothetical protein